LHGRYAYGAIGVLILARVFSIDARGLAVLRMAVAVIGLLDLALRLPDLADHFTDRGTLTRTDALQWFRGYHDWTISLHLIGGSLWSQIALFSLHAAALLALLLGWRTRAASVVAWLMVLSLTVRNPYLSYGGDILLRSLLFWLMLVPAGRAWSLDARAGDATHRACSTIACAGLLLQVWLVLFMAGLPKLGTDVWQQGLGLAYALDQEETTRPLGWIVRDFPALTRAMSHATLVVELGVSSLLWLPVPAIRFVAIAVWWALLLGITATIDVHLLPALTAAGMVVFVPPSAWDVVERRLPSFAGGSATGAPQQARPAVDAAPARTAGEWATQAVAAFAMVYLVIWNIGLWRSGEAYEPPAAVAWFGRAAMMRQSWGMFSDFTRTGWFTAPGTLADGRRVDLLAAGGPVPALEDALAAAETQGRPADVRSRYRDTHWLALFKILRQFSHQDGHFLHYGRYLCREWNRGRPGPEQLLGFEIVFVGRDVGAHLQRRPVMADYERTLLWTHDCFQ